MTGPEFLGLYGIAFALGLGLSVAGVAWVRKAPVTTPMELDVYGIAMLAGGPDRVVDTAIAGLASRGAVHVSPSGDVTPAEGAVGADPVEDAVLRDLRGNGRFRGDPVAEGLERRMRAAGYLYSADRACVAFRVWWLWSLLVAVGVYRIVAGMIHGLPVGLLIGSVVVAGVVGLAMVVWIYGHLDVDPTRRGREALENAAVIVGATVLLPVALAGLAEAPGPVLDGALDVAAPVQPSGGSGSGGGLADAGGLLDGWA